MYSNFVASEVGTEIDFGHNMEGMFVWRLSLHG
jgi:hypothetical protein